MVKKCGKGGRGVDVVREVWGGEGGRRMGVMRRGVMRVGRKWVNGDYFRGNFYRMSVI